MNVRNVHSRTLPTSLDAAGTLIDGLASDGDRLWPWERWPAIRFDGPLAVGAKGGHGPVRYTIQQYEPGRSILFRFSAPKGFLGTHRLSVESTDSGGVRLVHTLEMVAAGPARFSWPLVFRPLHDALLEDALDKAERAFGGRPTAARWSLYVRALRRLLRRRRQGRAG
ncbi:hypothetical protein [Azospirillum sp.]|uniref:hypothetical protein n=1 Tax=Azospirillum sp. TaxID=34012 RepID=UPI002D49A808|nr:hypothetical protein [Azospirillum sp.]HYD71071.1 hypothetical protein [Azospirillum sp.]